MLRGALNTLLSTPRGTSPGACSPLAATGLFPGQQSLTSSLPSPGLGEHPAASWRYFRRGLKQH